MGNMSAQVNESGQDIDDMPIVITITLQRKKNLFGKYDLEKRVTIQRGDSKFEFEDSSSIDQIIEESYREKLDDIRELMEAYDTAKRKSTKNELRKEVISKAIDLIYGDLAFKDLGHYWF